MRKALLLVLLVLLAPRAVGQTEYSADTWGVQWPIAMDEEAYAAFRFADVEPLYPGSAWLMLGHCYFFGKGGQPQDFQKAFACYEKAAPYFETENAAAAAPTTWEADVPDTLEAPEGAPMVEYSDTAAWEEPTIEGSSDVGAEPTDAPQSAFADYYEAANGEMVALPERADLVVHLGLCYQYGLGTTADAAKAKYWLSSMNRKVDDPRAWLQLGILCYKEQLYYDAADEFSRMVGLNDYAPLWMAELQLRGHGVTQDAAAAFRAFQDEAVRLRELRAQDEAEGTQEFRRAMDALAYVNLRLAECYRDGLGTKRNEAKAAACAAEAEQLGKESPTHALRQAMK